MNDGFGLKVVKKAICFVMAFFIICGFASYACAAAKGADCVDLCKAALKAGDAGHMQYQSDSVLDFGALSISDGKKVKSIFYVCDSKEAYSLCVIKADNVKAAKALEKKLKKYKKNNCGSDYLQDYEPDERAAFKNAVCGRKKSFVWYIAMSAKKSVNLAGEAAIRKKLQ